MYLILKFSNKYNALSIYEITFKLCIYNSNNTLNIASTHLNNTAPSQFVLR